MVGFSEIEDETRVSEWIEFRVGRASSNDPLLGMEHRRALERDLGDVLRNPR